MPKNNKEPMSYEEWARQQGPEKGLEEADWLPGGAEDFLIPQGLIKKLLKKGLGRMMAKEAVGKGVTGSQKRALDKLLKRGKTREPANITEHEVLDYGKMEKARKAGLNKPEHVIEYEYDKFGRAMPKKPRKIEYPE